MDLQKELSEARSEAVAKQLQEANMDRAKYFLEHFVVYELRRQKLYLNYHSVTFHVMNGKAIGYTTYASKDFDSRRYYEKSDEKESTLIAATIEAKKYKINPIIFEEKDWDGTLMTAYRFELRLF